MTKSKNNDLKTVTLNPGKTKNFSISLDTAHEKRLEQIKQEREDYISKSKIIGWALDDYLQKKGFKVVDDRRDRDREADVMLPETFQKDAGRAENIKSGQTRVFPIRLETVQDYFLEYIKESQEDFLSQSKIIEWALDEYFEHFLDDKEQGKTKRETKKTIKNSSTLVPYSTKLNEEYCELIRARAYAKRVTQREVLEEAMDKVYESDKEREEDLKLYRNK